MKSNSWKKFLSVMLLLTMIVSMLPSAAFAEETQSADAQTVTEETVKVEETKDEVKDGTKTEVKEEVKPETKTEVKEEVKPETKTEVKDETKDETKDEVKDETKDEVKDETKDEVKDETKDEVKDETKTEDKEKVKDEAEEETKDATKEYSDAVKAFLAAVAAISVPEDVSALSEDEVYGLLEQIDIAGGLYEELSKKEQALDVVVAAVNKLSEVSAALNEQLIELLALVSREEQTCRFQILYVGDEFNVGYSYGDSWNVTYTCQYSEGHSGYNHSIACSVIKEQVNSPQGSVKAGYSIVGWSKEAKSNPSILNTYTGTTATQTTYTIYIVAKKPVEKVNLSLTYDPNIANGGSGTSYTESATVNKDVTKTFDVKTIDQVTSIKAQDGYEFTGWNTKADGTGTAVGATIAISSNTTIYAQWKKLPTTATVIYHANGGTGADPYTDNEVDPSTYTVKTTGSVGFTAPSGKQFLYWTTTEKDDGTGTAYVPGNTINDFKAGDTVHLYAQWETGSTEPPTPDVDLTKLSITKSVDPATAEPGDELTYTIVVDNKSGATLKIYLNDVLPNGVTYKDFKYAGPEGAFTPGTGIDGTLVLENGQSATFTLIATVDANTSGVVTNTIYGTVKEVNGTPVEADYTVSDSVTTTITKPQIDPDWNGLTLTKTVNPTTAKPGDDLTYTIFVENKTGADLKIYLEDILPAGVTYKSYTYTGPEGAFTAGTGIDGTLSLKNGESATFTMIATVGANVSGDVTNKIKGTVKEIDGTSTDSGVTKEATATTTISSETKENVPVRVTVEFQGLDDVSEVPTGYKLTGDAANDFLTGEINLGAATSRPGHIFKEYAGTAEVVLDKTYTLKFVQSGYEVEGYDCTPDVEFTVNKSAKSTDIDKTISVEVTLNYSKKNLVTYKTVTVRTYFEGVTALPENFAYTLECLNAPKEAQLKGFQGPLTLTKGVDDKGVPYMEFTANDVQLQTVYPISFSFKQDKYDIAGYTCTPGSGEFTDMGLEAPTSDNAANLVLSIKNVYTPLDPVDMPVTVNVYFKGLDAATKLPAYALRGVAKNEILNGSITPFVKDETADTAVYTGTVKAVPGKAYTLKFIQSNFNIDGYLCDASATQTVNVTADKELGVVVNLTLNYTKVDLGKLTITKTENKSYATPGTTVRYTITVTNETGYDLTNVTVLDYLEDNLTYVSKTGYYDSKASVALIPSLANGKSYTFTISAKIKSGLSTGTVIENTAYVTSITIGGQKFDIQGLSDSAYITVTGGKGAPKTGDESNLGLWIAVMAASLACAGAAVVVYKKRRTGDD